MLDMMIGSLNSAFSIGEAKFYFLPVKKHHLNPRCSCGDPNCDVWSDLKNAGERKFYMRIFQRFPHLNTIVDSSKDLFWIKRQRQNLKHQKIESELILIYKNPLEFALSRLKRNSLQGWKRAWIQYHRLLSSLFDDWCSVRYRDLAQQPASILEKICIKLHLKFENGMENYWNKKHHMLFGNLSAKYHTLDKKDIGYKNSINRLQRIEKKAGVEETRIDASYRSIKYSVQSLKALPPFVIESAESKNLLDCMEFIGARDVSIKNQHCNNRMQININFPIPIVLFHQLKNGFRNEFCRFKYRRNSF